METFSALLTICVGNSPVTGEFPTQRPVTRNFDVFFFISAWTNGWANNRDTGDLRRHHAHYYYSVIDGLGVHPSWFHMKWLAQNSEKVQVKIVNWLFFISCIYLIYIYDVQVKLEYVNICIMYNMYDMYVAFVYSSLRSIKCIFMNISYVLDKHCWSTSRHTQSDEASSFMWK